MVSDEADLNGEFGCVIDGGNDLVFLRTGFFNVGSQETDGVDFKLNYKLTTSNAGEFKFNLAGTRTLSY